jgi:hypothetical protein
MDLDGTGSPAGLVTKILKAEPQLPVPVPIEDLARQLDIKEIARLETHGFEGGLLTDEARSSGIILVNDAARRGRRRFTIGHELGHFLIPTHKPKHGAEFLCSRDDMRRWSDKDQDNYVRMEVQANEFAALILMPPPFWRKEMAAYRDPALSQVIDLAGKFDVSKEAAARTSAQYHDHLVAIIVVKDGKIDKIYRDPVRFPYMSMKVGQLVPRQSIFHSASKTLDAPSDIQEVGAETWLQSDWGKRLPTLYEQVFFQQGGFALLMLWAEPAEEAEEDADEDRTSKQRLQDRQSRWRS